MIRKYHNHKLQTNPWHREEESHNNHQTPGRQLSKATSILFLTKMTAKLEWINQYCSSYNDTGTFDSMMVPT